jgi:hypothetical protein
VPTEIEKSQDSPGAEQSLAHPLAPHRHKRTDYIAEGFRNKTKGEGLFNLLTYTGVGLFGVTAFSVFATWLLKDSRFFSKQFEGTVEKLTDRFSKNAATRTATRDFIDDKLTIAALFTGGSIMSVLPIKWLEDSKAKIVKSFDYLIYGEERALNDPSIQQAHRELEEAPSQTWLSIGASRVSAFLATYGTSLLGGSMGSPLGKLSGHSIKSVSAGAGRAIDKALQGDAHIVEQIKTAQAASPHEIMKNEREATKIWSYITMDAFYTAITSYTLFAFTRVFGAFFGKESALDMQAEHAAVLPAAASAPASNIAAAHDEKPRATVAQAVHHDRLSAAAAHELTA